MIRHKGGQTVGKGVYWDLSAGKRIDIDNEGVLPGDESATYIKLATGIVLVLGPVFGLAYVIILPFMAIGTVAVLLVSKVSRAVLNLASRIVYFEWRPTEAYLAGKKRKEKKGKKDEVSGKDPGSEG